MWGEDPFSAALSPHSWGTCHCFWTEVGYSTEQVQALISQLPEVLHTGPASPSPPCCFFLEADYKKLLYFIWTCISVLVRSVNRTQLHSDSTPVLIKATETILQFLFDSCLTLFNCFYLPQGLGRVSCIIYLVLLQSQARAGSVWCASPEERQSTTLKAGSLYESQLCKSPCPHAILAETGHPSQVA